MLLVGLTGGLGAGKSTVARMLAERGAVVVDADELARKALERGTQAFKQVCDLFGEEVLTSQGDLDRKAVADRAFAEPEKRKALESIVHPEVFRMLAETVEAYRGTDDVVVFDAPLIVETGFPRVSDVVIVVSAPIEQQLARVAPRMSEEEARARIAAQSAPELREAIADMVIDNDGDLAELERQVDEVWEKLRRLTGGPS